MTLVEHVARMGDSRCVFRILVGISEWKRPVEGPRRRWEENIKIGLQEMGWRSIDWIGQAQNRDE